MKVTDPVCKMSLESTTAAAQYEYQGVTYYFCAAGCKNAFAANPEKYLANGQAPASGHHGHHHGGHGCC